MYIYKTKSLGIIDRQLQDEKHLLDDLCHKGKRRSSFFYSSCYNLYIIQIKELSDIYYSSLVETLNIDIICFGWLVLRVYQKKA